MAAQGRSADGAVVNKTDGIDVRDCDGGIRPLTASAT
jgi:hypothetical protein